MNPPVIAVTVPLKPNAGASEIDAVEAIALTPGSGVVRERAQAVSALPDSLQEVSQARQAIVQTDRHPTDVSFATIASGSPDEALQTERRAHQITRAGAEQARRLADCTRDCLITLIRHLDQPCLSVDRTGSITHWNEAMARFSDVTERDAIGSCWTATLQLAPSHPLHNILVSLTQSTYQSESWIAQILPGPIPLIGDIEVDQIKLIPLYHVPGSLSAIIVLASI